MLRWKMKSATSAGGNVKTVCRQIVALHKRGECITLLAHQLFGIERVSDSEPYSPENCGRAGIMLATDYNIACPERY